MTVTSPPHLDRETPLLRTRRGNFWIPGDVVQTGSVHVQRGPMHVEWETPEELTHPDPIVLIHGGGGQGTDWMNTPDGRPGWARLLVEQGFAVYVVDRVGHGRSPYHPDVIGPMGGPFPYEAGRGLFADESAADTQTAWPWGRHPGSGEIDQLVAGMGPLPADFALSQQLDSDRLAQVLDRVGQSILVTHSAGGPVGWLTVDARPKLVRGIVAVEPMGPAFVDFPGIGALSWGLTAAPMTTQLPHSTAAEIQAAGVEALTLPSLEGVPVALVTGGASTFANFRDQFADILTRSGARTEVVHLPDHDVEGNGHGLIFETNHDQVLNQVLRWVAATEADGAGQGADHHDHP